MTTLHDEIKLPPLPSPGIHPDEALDLGLESIPYFTADQVRQAQRDAVTQLALASDARIAELEAALKKTSAWLSAVEPLSQKEAEEIRKDSMMIEELLKGQP